MLRQDEMTMTLDMVAQQQKRHIWRDRIVGALLAVGIMVGAVALESAAAHANTAAQTPATQCPPVKVALK